jgi:two-component system, LytTR family, sensor kinase
MSNGATETTKLAGGRRRWERWGLLFGCWTLLGLFYSGQMYLIYARSNRPASWGSLLPFALIFWYAWAVLAPFVVRLSRRFPIGRKGWPRGLMVHLPASAIFAMIHEALSAVPFCVIETLSGRPCDVGMRLFGSLFSIFFTTQVIIYWMILFAAHALEYHRRYREEELRASRLEARLAQARLQALAMQLHPHFLFNTLQAISTLIFQDPEAADEMLSRLSDMLRLSLENVGAHEVSLKQELEFLQHYLEIEQARFRDRLRVSMSIDPEAYDARVPNMILQPLVENAVRHGIASRPEPGHVKILARRDGGSLMIEVGDDGPGIPGPPSAPPREGVGLTNTRARMEALYGARHRFELINAADGGLVVSMTLPFVSAFSEAMQPEMAE